MENKKAQGLSLNMIIIATLAIIVLVVVAIFFTSKFGQSNNALSDCPVKGGISKPSVSECPPGSIPTPSGSKIESEKYCCIILNGD